MFMYCNCSLTDLYPRHVPCPLESGFRRSSHIRVFFLVSAVLWQVCIRLNRSLTVDCGFSDILFGAEECTRTVENPEEYRHELVQDLYGLFVNECSPSPALICLSVRTAFDLYLSVADFPPDSEVLFSAINIPDMPFIARQHGLKVCPDFRVI